MAVILLLSFALNVSAEEIDDINRNPSGTNQQVTVRGTVTEASTGNPIPGVNVVVSGTTIGTITDASGNYSLAVPNTSVTLKFSFIGFVTQSVALGGRTTLNIALVAEVSEIEEIVVVGYGTQMKKDLTGSISSVQSARLLDKPAFNVA